MITRALRSSAGLAAMLCYATAAPADTATFQQGTGSYTACVDTMLKQATPGTPTGSGVTLLKWDTDDTPTYPGYSYVLLRFDNIFGSGPGQIPPGAVISSATLTYYVSNGGNPANANDVAVSWSAGTTWNTFGSTAGVQAEDYGAAVGSADGTVSVLNTLDVSSSVAAWNANPAANFGWILRPTGTDGVELYRSNHATVASRPKLTVNYTVSTSVALSPSSLLALQGRPAPLRVSIPARTNLTGPVQVTLTSSNPGVLTIAGGIGGVRTLTFAQNGPTEQRIWLTPLAIGSATITSTNTAGLSNASVAVDVSTGFTFTSTADPRTQDAVFDTVLTSINDDVGGPGVFHVSPGDIDPLQPLRDRIDSRFGPAALWFPGVGNHEEETVADMDWIRSEYLTGNGVRSPLANATRQDGPTGTVETTYTWQYGNTLFIMLNEYWNGGTAAGSDVATDGDIVPALYDWLAAKLNANDKTAVFVFGHEPAFPEHRHVGDSLDQYPANRDAFWSLLEDRRVQAYICGHTHYYSRYQLNTGRTWQVDVGNAGNDEGDKQTYLNVTVTPSLVRYDVWRNGTGTWQLAEYWTEPLRVAPDLDRDGDVDQEDFGRMQRCLTGGATVTEPGCLDADLDHNTHVDTDDLDRLVSCMSAPGDMVTACP